MQVRPTPTPRPPRFPAAPSPDGEGGRYIGDGSWEGLVAFVAVLVVLAAVVLLLRALAQRANAYFDAAKLRRARRQGERQRQERAKENVFRQQFSDLLLKKLPIPLVAIDRLLHDINRDTAFLSKIPRDATEQIELDVRFDDPVEPKMADLTVRFGRQILLEYSVIISRYGPVHIP